MRVGHVTGLRVALVAASLTGLPAAMAQDDPAHNDPAHHDADRRAVALVVGQDAADAFETFVAVEAEMHLTATPVRPPAAAAMLVSIDTRVPLVRVWRRSDGVVFERRFTGPEDGYALAVVASELLEVARTGGDPRSVGATVVVAAVESDAVATDPVPGPLDASMTAATDDDPEARTGPPDSEEAGWSVEGTLGLGVEGWFSLDADPFLVQPTLFVELLGGRDSWRVGGSIFASALGSYAFAGGGFEGDYARQELGARLSVGGDLGSFRTRLLAHLRGGAAVVVGSARRQGDGASAEATRPSWFLGLGLELRQPMVEGLEIFLDVSADVLPAPVRFTALGATLVREPSARLAGRLGLAWRFR